MILKKVTTGFVIQEFDTETKEWVGQEFVAGEQVDWENEDGETVEPLEVVSELPYLPFDMLKP